MKQFVVLLLLLFCQLTFAQHEVVLPYREIPPAPPAYTAGTVAARVLDGLGFRFYWATEGLRAIDLAYKPGNDTRTTEETIRHIHGLTVIILNTAKKAATPSGAPPTDLPFERIRQQTLENIRAAADILREVKDADLQDMKVVFKGDSGLREFPFWNLLNGPIDDALWHVGQVVTFRRSSGNPYNNKASVFSGKVQQ
jgi:hypothetical protein